MQENPPNKLEGNASRMFEKYLSSEKLLIKLAGTFFASQNLRTSP